MYYMLVRLSVCLNHIKGTIIIIIIIIHVSSPALSQLTGADCPCVLI